METVKVKVKPTKYRDFKDNHKARTKDDAPAPKPTPKPKT